jgi:hypothetical protein
LDTESWPRRRALLPCYHTHQRALPAAVDSNEANVILLEHIKRDIKNKVLSPKLFSTPARESTTSFVFLQ